MKEELLKQVYKAEKQYVAENGQRLFDCLVALVEDGTIESFDQLYEYL